MNGIKVIRKKIGLSQAELAQRVGVTRESISRYEDGSRTPSLQVFQKLASALGCTLDELVGKTA